MSKLIQSSETSNSREFSTFLLNRAVTLLRSLNVLEPDKNSRVVNFEHPKELEEHLDLTIARTPLNEEVLNLCQEIIIASVKTNHIHFHNQLYGGLDPYGLVGALITEALNTNQHTYEVAPAFTLIEHAVIKHVSKLFQISNGDGIFVPGGSISNMYGLILARHKRNPSIKQEGLFGLKPLVVFTSEDAHYSITKGVNWLGIGVDNLVKVPCDQQGRMLPDQLESAISDVIRSGRQAFFVNATAGTTVLGAFDPLDVIANICKKYDLWLHVDACWGGSMIFSKQYDGLLDGIYRADSLSWNSHKMLGAPLQCSIFITKHKGLLYEANNACASYLFQQDKFYDVSYDTGDKSLQCGRKVDSFKLWLMWKARGDEGFQKLVDQAIDCTRYFQRKIINRPGFRLVNTEENNINVCFWYIPKRLRNCDETNEWWNEISTIAPRIKERLTKQGTLLISYQPLKCRNLVNFFRLINSCHPNRKYEDMDYIIQQIEDAGYDM